MTPSKIRRALVSAAAVGLGFAWAAPAFAQGNYPSRPVTLIVPWGAGGGTDATARIIGRCWRRKSASRSTW